jgi:ABC-2 type transport system ATP-binding protein
MIKVENLSKSFGATRAVDDVTFEVARGEVLGFIGPNGSGKSTTMRMITGFIPPSAGKVSVCGYDMLQNPIPAKRRIGYLPESAASYDDMSVVAFLRFAADMRGLTGDAKRRAVSRAAEMCFLEPVLGQTIDTLSKGFRHRTCFAQALIHDPDVLILDEPTDGLDPNQKHEVRALIRRMGESKAIIFSTHILEEVEEVCSRAIIIDRGRIVANGTPDELKARSARAGAVELTLAGANAESVSARLSGLPGLLKSEILVDEPSRVSLRAYPDLASAGSSVAGGALAGALAELAVRENWKIEQLHTEVGRLDEVFRAITWSETASEAAHRVAATEVRQ